LCLILSTFIDLLMILYFVSPILDCSNFNPNKWHWAIFFPNKFCWHFCHCTFLLGVWKRGEGFDRQTPEQYWASSSMFIEFYDTLDAPSKFPTSSIYFPCIFSTYHNVLDCSVACFFLVYLYCSLSHSLVQGIIGPVSKSWFLTTIIPSKQLEYNTNNNILCESCFREIWENSYIGCLTSYPLMLLSRLIHIDTWKRQ